MNPASPLVTAIWEADRHTAAQLDALADWTALSSNDLAAIEADRLLVRLVDQILFRFGKLQDAMGERLVPATLTHLAEPFEDWPMRDRLNRLEKLGFVQVDDWLRWREVRNRLAHEYPDAPELRAASLRAAVQAAREVAAQYADWRRRVVPPN